MAQLIRLKRRDVEPPGGWRYRNPEDGFSVVAGDFESLLRAVARHRSANDQKIPPNLPAVVEDYICQRIPPSLVIGEQSFEKISQRPVLLSTVKKATGDMFHLWRHAQRRRVTMEEVQRRAAVCINCPYNSTAAACTSCRGLVSWCRSFLGKNLPGKGYLFVCQVSAVMNIAQVHMPREVVLKMMGPNIRTLHPEKCWKRKETDDG